MPPSMPPPISSNCLSRSDRQPQSSGQRSPLVEPSLSSRIKGRGLRCSWLQRFWPQGAFLKQFRPQGVRLKGASSLAPWLTRPLPSPLAITLVGSPPGNRNSGSLTLSRIRPPLPSWLGTSLLMVALGGGLTALQLPRLQARTTPQPLDPAEVAAIQDLTAAQLQLRASLPTLGFDNLIANWTFLGFIQYFGDSEARALSDYSVAPDFFEVIVKRDPYFTLPYVFLSSSITLYAAQPATTIRLLDQGIARLFPTFPPDSFRVVRYKAIDELLFLGNPDQARETLLKTAEWADQSPLPEADNAAAVSRRTAAFLEANPDSLEAQVNGWLMIWSNAVNEEVQALAVAEIQALGFDLVLDNGRATIVPLEQTSPSP